MTYRMFSKPTILIGVVFLMNSGFCCDKLTALSDLLVQAMNRPSTVTVGQVFEVTADAFNKSSDEKCDTETLGAGINKFLMRILQSNGDPNTDNWPVVYEDANYNVPPLSADELQQLLFELQVNQADTYKYQGYIDYYDDVEERNENNNGYIAKKGQIDERSNNYASFIFIVEPNEQGVGKMEGPVVQVVGYRTVSK